MKKGKEKKVDLKDVVTDLAVKRDSVVGLTVSGGGPTVRVSEIVKAIFGIEDVIRIRKVEVCYAK
jgi:hypothetical protein